MSISTSPRTAGPRAKFGLLLLGSIAGIMAAGGASAARLDSEAPSVVVKYSEQSLATDDGVYALYRRITAAAKRVCPDAAGTHNWNLQAAVDRCRNDAIAGAIRQIDNSRLAALHAARSKNG
jgi:UrcA family protein